MVEVCLFSPPASMVQATWQPSPSSTSAHDASEDDGLCPIDLTSPQVSRGPTPRLPPTHNALDKPLTQAPAQEGDDGPHGGVTSERVGAHISTHRVVASEGPWRLRLPSSAGYLYIPLDASITQCFEERNVVAHHEGSQRADVEPPEEAPQASLHCLMHHVSALRGRFTVQHWLIQIYTEMRPVC